MRTFAIEGRDHGIQVNRVSPGGVTRMHEAAFGDPEVIAILKAAMPSELAAPGIVWLASDDCTITGQNFSLWAGRFAKLNIASGRGLVDRQLTPEKISAGIELAMSPADAYEPEESIADVNYWFAAMGVLIT
jgi:NAD(P)-dependent dehydrogenase (short-subunit alcohol dehydrogenase family)